MTACKLTDEKASTVRISKMLLWEENNPGKYSRYTRQRTVPKRFKSTHIWTCFCSLTKKENTTGCSFFGKLYDLAVGSQESVSHGSASSEKWSWLWIGHGVSLLCWMMFCFLFFVKNHDPRSICRTSAARSFVCFMFVAQGTDGNGIR